MYVYSVACWQI